jgi:hypothetical protein
MTALTAPRAFHVMSKPTGAICNLDCEYCFFLSKDELYPGSGFRMAPARAVAAAPSPSATARPSDSGWPAPVERVSSTGRPVRRG